MLSAKDMHVNANSAHLQMQCQPVVRENFTAHHVWRCAVTAGLGRAYDFAHEVFEPVAPVCGRVTPLGVVNHVVHRMEFKRDIVHRTAGLRSNVAEAVVMLQEQSVGPF